MTGSASGQYYEDAKQRGMNDEEAQKYLDDSIQTHVISTVVNDSIQN